MKLLNTLIAVAVLFLANPVSATNPGSTSLCSGNASGGTCQPEGRELTSGCSYQNNCFGRCGPGCSTYFGTTNTTACQHHDECIKDNVCGGKTAAQAHLNCLTGTTGCTSGACGSLASAAKSLIGAHWDNSVNWVKSNLISTWAKIR